MKRMKGIKEKKTEQSKKERREKKRERKGKMKKCRRGIVTEGRERELRPNGETKQQRKR